MTELQSMFIANELLFLQQAQESWQNLADLYTDGYLKGKAQGNADAFRTAIESLQRICTACDIIIHQLQTTEHETI